LHNFVKRSCGFISLLKSILLPLPSRDSSLVVVYLVILVSRLVEILLLLLQLLLIRVVN